MILEDFDFLSSIELKVSDHILDLHNNYNLMKFVSSEDVRTVSILFQLDTSFETPDKIKQFTLLFSGVDYVVNSSHTDKMKIKDIADFGFKNANDSDLEWLIEPADAAEDDHFVIRFETDAFIRIHAEKAKVNIS